MKKILVILLVSSILLSGCMDKPRTGTEIVPQQKPEVLQLRFINRTFEPVDRMVIACHSPDYETTVGIPIEINTTGTSLTYQDMTYSTIDGIPVSTVTTYKFPEFQADMWDITAFDNASEHLYSKFNDEIIDCDFLVYPVKVYETVYLGCSCNVSDENTTSMNASWVLSEGEYYIECPPYPEYGKEDYDLTLWSNETQAIRWLSFHLYIDAQEYLWLVEGYLEDGLTKRKDDQ